MSSTIERNTSRIDDDYIISLFFGNRQLRLNIYKKYHDDVDTVIHQYIVNRFQDSQSFDESLYRIKHRVEKRPVCEECGKELKFHRNNKKTIFGRFCSKKCANKNELSRQKLRETCLLKYGVDNPAKSEIVKKKSIETCLRRYGVKNGGGSKEALEKIKKTSLERYGVENYAQLDSHQSKLKSKETVEKRITTKRKNNTFNKSSQEDQSFEILKEIYPDVVRQHKSEKYPFSCDFYVPSLDLYIECNYHWTHGKHPYNPNSSEDQKKIEYWKSKHTKYYDNAVKTWTQYDVKKREIAKLNKLNYVEFWNINNLKINK